MARRRRLVAVHTHAQFPIDGYVPARDLGAVRPGYLDLVNGGRPTEPEVDPGIARGEEAAACRTAAYLPLASGAHRDQDALRYGFPDQAHGQPVVDVLRNVA